MNTAMFNSSNLFSSLNFLKSIGLWLLGVHARCYLLPRLLNCLSTVQSQMVQLLFENDGITTVLFIYLINSLVFFLVLSPFIVNL